MVFTLAIIFNCPLITSPRNHIANIGIGFGSATKTALKII